ncbi:MAG: ABC transporter permease subunit [Saprospiraceae bacterium]|nr:ABC transporter permease subunit [Saprospiraceae bacterium]MCB9319016.1 ABC transporter permease subunit [Lewinellaceae bacterium]
MWSIYRKEIRSLFSSLIAYIVIGFFLLVMGLMTWVFPEYSVLDYPYASLESFFRLAPTILTIMIPAITMRSFAEESQTGTLELLLTRPITLAALVWGKYLAYLSLVLITLLPTLIYYISLKSLAATPAMVDGGETLSAYLGLALQAASFTGIGMLASTWSSNQIIAFITGVFMCFILQWGFVFISKLPGWVGTWDYIVQQFGIDAHYSSISRGVIDSRDLLYFFTLILLSVEASHMVLASRT